MKLLLVSDSGEPVACLDSVEEFGVRESSSVFAMLDLLESMIAAAKDGGPVGGTRGPIFATGSAGRLAV